MITPNVFRLSSPHFARRERFVVSGRAPELLCNNGLGSSVVGLCACRVRPAIDFARNEKIYGRLIHLEEPV